MLTRPRAYRGERRNDLPFPPPDQAVTEVYFEPSPAGLVHKPPSRERTLREKPNPGLGSLPVLLVDPIPGRVDREATGSRLDPDRACRSAALINRNDGLRGSSQFDGQRREGA